MSARRFILPLLFAMLMVLSSFTTIEAARFTSRASFEAKAKIVLASHSSAVLIDKGCCSTIKKCCYEPCICYRYRGCRRVCCGCEQPTKAVLKVVDPQCCCYVNVPVCIPPCCKGEPCVTSHCGVLGRGVVTYRWCCGFKIRVVITACKDFKVTYFGL